jgi:hypothetical protein
MAFTVPTFNLSANVWHAPNTPPSAPDATVACNLAFGRRTSSYQGLYSSTNEPIMSLLLNPSEDIRGPQCVAGADVVEVPAGSGRIYQIIGVDDIGKGFANEHRAALLVWTVAFGSWPTPIP